MRLLLCLISLLLVTVDAAFAADDYKLGPDSMPQTGVPAGRAEGPLLFRSHNFTNTLRNSSRGALAGWTARFSDWLGDRGFMKQP